MGILRIHWRNQYTSDEVGPVTASTRAVLSSLAVAAQWSLPRGNRAPDALQVALAPAVEFATVLVEYLSKSATS